MAVAPGGKAEDGEAVVTLAWMAVGKPWQDEGVSPLNGGSCVVKSNELSL